MNTHSWDKTADRKLSGVMISMGYAPTPTDNTNHINDLMQKFTELALSDTDLEAGTLSIQRGTVLKKEPHIGPGGNIDQKGTLGGGLGDLNNTPHPTNQPSHNILEEDLWGR